MTAATPSFQEAFSAALFAPEEATHPEVVRLVAQPAFAVYRNTVMKGCIDALEANFPAVARLVGRAWFRAAAALHAADDAPRDGRLLHYGVGFPAFLERFEPAVDLAYLPDVARLDVLWRESHAARDAKTLDSARLVSDAHEELARRVLKPHPAARWRWFATQPIYSIWSRNRPLPVDETGSDRLGDREQLVWQGEGALLTRPRDAVTWQAASRAECAFLDACAEGMPLIEASEAALRADPGAELGTLLRQLLLAGAFAASDPPLAASSSS